MSKAIIDKSLTLHYQVIGHGLPIVFIHPPVLGHKVFKHQQKLAENYQLIFYDLPGHGQSTTGSHILSIPLLAEELRKLLDIIGVEKVVVCGFSHGTLIAQEFALRYPERTNALILCSGYPEVKSLNIKSLAAGGIAFSTLHQVPLLAKILAKTHRFYKEDEVELYHYAKKANGRKISEYIKAGLNYKSTPFLYQLDMPVLLVYGTLEKMNHRYRKVFEREISNLQVVFVDGATHQLPPRSFMEFNKIIDQFLKSLSEFRH